VTDGRTVDRIAGTRISFSRLSSSNVVSHCIRYADLLLSLDTYARDLY
jgi:hypothetical protein